MGKYLLLYQGGAGMMLTDEERNAELARWAYGMANWERRWWTAATPSGQRPSGC